MSNPIPPKPPDPNYSDTNIISSPAAYVEIENDLEGSFKKPWQSLSQEIFDDNFKIISNKKKRKHKTKERKKEEHANRVDINRRISAFSTNSSFSESDCDNEINLTIHGEGGHGSTFSDGTAMQKVQKLMDITSGFREQQKKIMVSKDVNDFGSYTTFNINIIKGGVATNIIPSKVTVVIDMRLAVTAEVHEVEALIQSWIAQVGNETELSFIRKLDVSKATILDDSNPYWAAVVDAVREMDMKIIPIVSPATSDMIYLRNREYSGIGFAYRPYTVSLIHAADEYLNMVTFLKGIDMYARILKKIGNIL